MTPSPKKIEFLSRGAQKDRIRYLIFLYIKNYILKLIKSEVINILETFVRDFEVSTHKAFKKNFQFIENLKHNYVFSIF